MFARLRRLMLDRLADALAPLLADRLEKAVIRRLSERSMAFQDRPLDPARKVREADEFLFPRLTPPAFDATAMEAQASRSLAARRGTRPRFL